MAKRQDARLVANPVQEPPIELGLALSGGGFRAMLFHLGALYRLNELGLLGKVDAVSGVSGGSFVTGVLASRWSRLVWEGGRATNFDDVIARPIEDLSRRRLDAPIVALGLLPFVNPANVLAWVLDRGLFHGIRLDQLPDAPRFVFNATHLATGTGWYFSKEFMGTYRVGRIEHPTEKLAVAVAASAAFPPIVSPLVLRMNPSSWKPNEGLSDLYGDIALRRKALLLDGGAYDNMGLQYFAPRNDSNLAPVQPVKTLLVSDGGGNLSVDSRTWRYTWWSAQLKRTLDMSVEQDRALRRQDVIAASDAGSYKLAMWRTVTNPAKFSHVKQPFSVSATWRNYLATRPTRMWPFSERDRHALVDWGYLASDLALRAFLAPHSPAPTLLPRGTDFGIEPAAVEVAGGS